MPQVGVGEGAGQIGVAKDAGQTGVKSPPKDRGINWHETKADEVGDKPFPSIPLFEQDLIIEGAQLRFPVTTHTCHNHATMAMRDGPIILVTFLLAHMGIMLYHHP